MFSWVDYLKIIVFICIGIGVFGLLVKFLMIFTVILNVILIKEKDLSVLCLNWVVLASEQGSNHKSTDPAVCLYTPHWRGGTPSSIHDIPPQADMNTYFWIDT